METVRAENHLSLQAKSLWGKSDRRAGETWLPLYIHLFDASQVAIKLWDVWLPPHTRRLIARAFGNDEKFARTVYVFLTGTHDIGKAIPSFQGQNVFAEDGEHDELRNQVESAGLPTHIDFGMVSRPTHAVAGELILERFLEAHEISPWIFRSFGSIVGNHHGKPPVERNLDIEFEVPGAVGKQGSVWEKVQDELISFVQIYAQLDNKMIAALQTSALTAPIASLLTGLVIMADWIASNEQYFPLLPLMSGQSDFDDIDFDNELVGATLPFANNDEEYGQLRARADRAWTRLHLTPYWYEDDVPTLSEITQFCSRFDLPVGAQPRPIQQVATKLVEQTPGLGLMIIEAPMGEGKTEAALAAAEMLAARSGLGGVMVALPTMATTDAMFGRVHAWLNRLPQAHGERRGSVYLAHGKAFLNDEFTGILGQSRAHRMDVCTDVDDDQSFDSKKSSGSRITQMQDNAIASDWLFGRKKGLLANFVVCTVDQVLMGALQMKHLALRQLALANKVVIIDECHAYDVYMQQYLIRVLEWLGSWNAPVILLSATFPDAIRAELSNAYIKGHTTCRGCPQKREPEYIPVEVARDAYPLVTYTQGDQICTRQVAASGRSMILTVRLMSDEIEDLVALLKEKLAQGGCAGVICDTVRRAQQVASILAEKFDSQTVKLTHSRFMDCDRMENEHELRELLGPHASRIEDTRPERLIVVGTQVLEQSLDIDFDILISDIVPTDLMFRGWVVSIVIIDRQTIAQLN